MKIHFKEQQGGCNYGITIVYAKKYKDLMVQFHRLLNNVMGTIKAFDDEYNTYWIPVIQISYLEVLYAVCYIHVGTRIYKTEDSFKQLKEKANRIGFCQVNVRTMVNIQHVHYYGMRYGCHREICLWNGQSLTVNRTYVKSFLKMMDEWSRTKYEE